MEKTGTIGQKFDIGQKVKITPEGEPFVSAGTGIILRVIPTIEHSPENFDTGYILYQIAVITGKFDIHREKNGELCFWDFELEPL